jgi:hypothetical protein
MAKKIAKKKAVKKKTARKPARRKVEAIPRAYGSITAALAVRGAVDAIAFS